MDVRALSEAEKKVYRKAQEALRKGAGAVAFAELMFGPKGELSRLGETSTKARQAVMKSELYQWSRSKLEALRKVEVADFEQQMELVSGRLTIVVPKSLHAVLKNEAAWEGVSLSELIRLKLGVPYMTLTKQFLTQAGKTRTRLRTAAQRTQS